MPYMLYERYPAGHYAIFTMNRPDRLNAQGAVMREELTSALAEFTRDPEMRVGIVTGAGRAFSAGADLREMAERDAAGNQEDQARLAEMPPEVRMEGLRQGQPFSRNPKPFIAAVNGLAMAGGLELILACDLVIAAESARIGDGHSKFGLLPGGGASVRLPRVVGRTRALEMFFTAELYPAGEMRDWGLVNEVVPDDQLDETTSRLAAQLASRSPLGLTRMKKLVNETADQPTATALSLELLYSMLHEKSHDMSEGVAAFVEKREPRFTGN